MIAVNIRKQGGAAIMTLPAQMMKLLDLHIGSMLELYPDEGGFKAKPVSKKRYSLDELLEGVSEEEMKILNDSLSETREGGPVGRELG